MMPKKEKVIKRKTEFSNIEVRRFLNRFFDLPKTDKLTPSDLIVINSDSDHILYSFEFETDSDGYIVEYRLLAEELRYIGIRIGENAWVCTTRQHNIHDVRFIANITKQLPEEMPIIHVDERQLDLLS